MDVVQPAYMNTYKLWSFRDLFMLLLALDLPTVRQLLLKQAQLKSVTLGHLNDTRLDVMDTVKVLKCYSGIAT